MTVDVSKDILIEENELLKSKNSQLENNILILEKTLKRTLKKSSTLMLKLVNVRAGIEYCKKFNYSLDENYKKGFSKAFELIEKVLNSDE